MLPGFFQSDRLEGEFGIYRQLSGGNYFISLEQVYSSLRLQRLKLFHLLKIEDHKAHVKSSCCVEELQETELQIVDNAISECLKFSKQELATLCFICGYITKKIPGLECLNSADIIQDNSSEFIPLVSRGKLKLPSEDLFQFSIFLYNLFQKSQPCVCHEKLMKMSTLLYDSLPFSISNIKDVIRRFLNTFYKGLVSMVTDGLLVQPSIIAGNRKKRKLTCLP